MVVLKAFGVSLVVTVFNGFQVERKSKGNFSELLFRILLVLTEQVLCLFSLVWKVTGTTLISRRNEEL